MLKGKSTTLTAVKGNDSEYIVKDEVGITIGRIFIVELLKENEYCTVRIKFYRKGKESYEYLNDAVKVLLLSLFKNLNINKVSVLVEEDISISALTDLGFEIEGIISNSIIVKGEYKDELLFGLDREGYENGQRKREVILNGRNISLKVLTPEFDEIILDYYIRNKEYLSPFEPTRDETFYTLAVQREDLIQNYRHFLNGDGVNFGIFKGEKFIGKIRISNIVIGVFKNCFIGYSIDKNEQGNGYMKEAVNLIIDYCFDDLELHRIEASALVNNLKSQAVLRSCGFKELGINEKYLFINGEWRDHITFYKVKE